MERTVAAVGVQDTAYHFDLPYTYVVPDGLKATCLPGCRVMVNFGVGSKNRRQGIVLDVFCLDDDKKYKSILAVLDEAPLLNYEMIQLVHWLKEHTFCTYFEAAKVQLPVGFNLKRQEYYAVDEEKTDTSVLDARELEYFLYLKNRTGFVKRETLNRVMGCQKDGKIPERLYELGFFKKETDFIQKVNDATQKFVRLSQLVSPGKLTEKQQAVYDLLSDVGQAGVKEVCYFTGVGQSVIKTMEKHGLVELFDSPIYRVLPSSNITAEKKEIILTPLQQKAFENMLNRHMSDEGGTTLLYGVTGSGKTGVFMRLVDEVLKQGRGVIVMVPEISLTPQVLSGFKSRYGQRVAVFHSALSMGQRRDEYLRVKKGQAKIAIGTRSAVFAPFSELGLIVMDEEQESTYKSESSPRFDAREVARIRCAYHKASLVLASATPSVESYTYALNGRYHLEVLPERYGNARLPQVVTVDLRADRSQGNKYDISSPLLQMLEQNLNQKKQSILLINRRGYNTFAACNQCGHVITCPSCSISLTYHHANGRMMCHYCGYSTPLVKTCPACGKNDIRYAGYGTQKLEDELAELLPQARVLRMDTDTTMSRFSHEEKLSAFEAGEYDIMLGTQMVAKGLDFPNVTLVGVICADQQLNNDDFRSMERTFDLLTQVVGRSGRGDAQGRAVIQTMTPENNVIRLAAKQDYQAFYASEIAIRKYLTYPPFCDICALTFISRDEPKASLCAAAFLNDIRQCCQSDYQDLKLIVLGPMPPRVAKISEKFRYRLIIKCKNNNRLRSMISELLVAYGKKKEYADVTVCADINPSGLI